MHVGAFAAPLHDNLSYQRALIGYESDAIRMEQMGIQDTAYKIIQSRIFNIQSLFILVHAFGTGSVKWDWH